MLPLEEALKLEIWLGSVEEDDIHVNIVPVLVKEVLQEHRDGLERDVSTDNNVPGFNFVFK